MSSHVSLIQESIPIISTIWQFAYIGLLDPSDQFLTRMRKMWVALMFLLSILPIASFIHLLSIQHPTTIPYASAVVVLVGQWAYACITHDVPPWLIMLVSQLMSVIQIVATLLSPLDNFTVPYIAYIMRIAMSGFSRRATLANLVVPITGLLITEFNHAYADSHGPFISLPGVECCVRTIPPYVPALFALVYLAFLIFIIWQQSEEFIITIDASSAAVAMSRDVSEKLVLYDTAGALAVLDASPSVNAELVTAFRQMSTNLDMYRPFLPEALLAVDDVESPDLLASSFIGDDFIGPRSNPEEADDEPFSHMIAVPDVPGVVGVHHRERPGSPLLDSQRISRHRLSQSHAGPFAPIQSYLKEVGPIGEGTLRFASGLHHRKVTVLRIVFPTAHVLAQGNPEAAHAFGTDMLRGVYECAKRHDGICMSLTPLTVVVCWNGHKSCLNHERHAVQCALDIVAECLVLFEGIPWTVFIAGGLGVVGTTGSDNQKSTVILGAVPHLLDLMSHLSFLYPQSVLITDKVRDVARVAFASRIVDVLSVGGASTYVFEVLDATEARSHPPTRRHATDDLEAYNDGFSALQCHEYPRAAEKFLEYMRQSEVADPQAYRLYQVSTYLAAGHEWHPRMFTGWSSFEECSGSIRVPIATTLPSPEPSQRIAPVRITVPPLVSGDDQLLRSQIKTFKELRSPLQPPNLEPQRSSPGKQVTNTDSLDSKATSNSSNMSQIGAPQPIPTSFVTVASSGHRQWRRSEKILGSGAFGQVWLGMGTGGDLIAMKTVPIIHVLEWEDKLRPNPLSRRRSTDSSMTLSAPHQVPTDTMGNVMLTNILQEVTLLSNLRDENIVGYVGSAVVDGVLIILMEYVPGGSLASLLKEFTVLDVAPTQRYVRDVVRGLCFLHRSGVLHKDIKPHNVLLMTDGQCKLTDFGASAKLAHLHGEANKVQGTPLYMAPEQCMGRACKASDVWAVGVMTYQLLTGKLPYSDDVLAGVNGFQFMYTLGRDETMVPEMPFGIPPMARAFCEMIFKRDPTQRPSAEELLHHPFII